MDINPNEQESLGEATDFFTSPPVMVAEEDSYLMKIHPTSSIDNNAPIIYEFDVDDQHYADLNSSFQYLRMRIMKGDRTNPVGRPGGADPPGDGHKGAPINYPSNTIFQDIQLSLNGHLIESSNNLYPYKSFMQTFLSFGEETKKNQLAVSGYYKDTGNIDADATRASMNDAGCDNKGLHQRFEMSKYSTPFSTLGPLHLDFCTQNRYVQNRTHVKIRLTRADDKFGIISNADNADFSYVIQQAYLMVRMVRPRESLRLAVEQALETNLAKYPLRKCEMRFFTFAGNSNTMSEPNLYQGHLPTRLALGLVDTRALDGHWQKSPFNFQPFDVNEIDVKLNGKSVTTDPLKINLGDNDYVHPYFWMFKSTGGLFENEALIDYSQYKNGHFLYVFDLTEDGEHGLDHFHQPKTGTLSLDIRVNQPPGRSVSLIAMIEREVIITCDKDRTYKVTG